jgi:flotillin
LSEAGGAYLDLKRLEMAPALTREIAAALANGQFVNFGGGGEGHGAAATGSDDVLRVVQTLMAAQIVTGNNFNKNGGNSDSNDRPPGLPQTSAQPAAAPPRKRV